MVVSMNFQRPSKEITRDFGKFQGNFKGISCKVFLKKFQGLFKVVWRELMVFQESSSRKIEIKCFKDISRLI